MEYLRILCENMGDFWEKHKRMIGELPFYEMSKVWNRDDCAETEGKKADILFVPQLSLQPHIKDIAIGKSYNKSNILGGIVLIWMYSFKE